MSTTSTVTPFILAQIEEVTYGLPALQVRELVEARPLAPFPTSRPFLLGVTFWRGVAVPVLDLGHLLGHSPTVREEHERFVMVEYEEQLVGLQANQARDFVELPTENIRPLPTEQPGRPGAVKAARFKQEMILLLDVSILLRGALESSTTAYHGRPQNTNLGETN